VEGPTYPSRGEKRPSIAYSMKIMIMIITMMMIMMMMVE
jgi:hypothetical protein